MRIGFGESKKIAEFLPQFGSSFTVKTPPITDIRSLFSVLSDCSGYNQRVVVFVLTKTRINVEAQTQRKVWLETWEMQTEVPIRGIKSNGIPEYAG